MPEDGEVPSFTAASEKYSILSETANGDDGRWVMISLGDLFDRSELLRWLVLVDDGLRPCRNFASSLKNEFELCILGVIGEVAIGIKNESTIGFFVAVYSAVRTRRGPAGLGMTMTSGTCAENEVVADKTC